MAAVRETIHAVAPTRATVLLHGETGTGKELFARSLHDQSPRRNQPFIVVNCAAIPEALVESTLFGHERGAFTGAISRFPGAFERAHRGTLLLDEVSEMRLDLQAKLLRAIQEREFERVGGTETVRTDVRVLAATNRNLEELVSAGRFREDLYYRLNVFPIHVPPLRERRSDILLLADFFVEKYARANNKTVHRISAPALDLLVNSRWRGNVRELENCIERAVLLTDEDVIRAHHLPPTVQNAESSPPERVRTLGAALDDVEREMILDALRVHRGNMSKAAKALGLTDRMMGLRVRKHGVRPRDFRTAE
jgi:Nif-specific regulatory protein